MIMHIKITIAKEYLYPELAIPCGEPPSTDTSGNLFSARLMQILAMAAFGSLGGFVSIYQRRPLCQHSK